MATTTYSWNVQASQNTVAAADRQMTLGRALLTTVLTVAATLGIVLMLSSAGLQIPAAHEFSVPAVTE